MIFESYLQSIFCFICMGDEVETYWNFVQKSTNSDDEFIISTAAQFTPILNRQIKSWYMLSMKIII